MFRRLLALLLPPLVHFAACAPVCEGISVGGRCEEVCKDERCAVGARCVDNACAAACSSASDCLAGQRCERRMADTGTEGTFCTTEGGGSTGGGEGERCARSADCAQRFGLRCVEGTCTLTCDVHSQCGSRGACTGSATDADGKAVATCVDDGLPRGKGQFGTACPRGDECDATTGFECRGAAPGDIDAYCTRRGCTADAECPSGDACATVRASNPPCEDACGVKGRTQAGCIPADQIGAGKLYQCGPRAMESHVCRHREFCAPCESDADCRALPNQVCAKDQSGEKICTVLCDPALNSCPWGNAAVCGVWDAAVGAATCAHRFGSCHGEGAGCEPCVDQRDCPRGLCTYAQFTGEQYCVDLDATCACPDGTSGSCSGGGCPKTPAGLPMTCLGGAAYSTSSLFGACLGASDDPTSGAGRESCWPRL